MKKYALATVAAAAFAMSASADITMNIWDDGTDLYMSATGDYDMSNAADSSIFSGLGANAVMWAATDLFGWETNLGGTGSVGYVMSQTGVLTATGDSNLGAETVTNTTPFFFFSNQMYFSNDAAIAGSVDETAIFENTTLASLGMIVGESVGISWGNGGLNEGGSINVIPAPGAFALLGLACIAGRRRRA